MLQYKITLVIAFSILLTLTEANTTCNLATAEQQASLCNISDLSEPTYTKLVKSVLFKIDANDLIWANKYQPMETRWSKVCPSTLCTNNCDIDGFCQVGTDLKLVDNLIPSIQNKFKLENSMRIINVTFDLANEDERLISLLESTRSLDTLRSRPNRLLNQFRLKSIEAENPLFSAYGCKAAVASQFGIHAENEALHLSLNSLNKEGCYVLKLTVQRGDDTAGRDINVLINLKDTRLDKPRFDQFVYNFTITENAPLDTIIGQVHAEFFTKLEQQQPSAIQYRIVPFVSSFGTFDMPVMVDYMTGQLNQALNIDREKYLIDKKSQQQVKAQMPDNSQVGLLSLKLESSHESDSYAYCKVNIFINDINDNAPVARISPLPRFMSRRKSDGNTRAQLFVDEHTAINQILAYVAVFDPDAAENGTIKSIDLTLSESQTAPEKRQELRAAKLEQLKLAGLEHLIPSEALSKSVKELPFKLNKIGDKMYTIQLTSKLDYKQLEGYTVEMRIQDNGTRPQLESKSLIQLNVLGANNFAPVFTNKQSELELEELTSVDTNKAIFKFQAIDLDDNRNGQVFYKLLSNPYKPLFSDEVEAKKMLASTFSLNRVTGELRLLRALNRDEIDGNKLVLAVTAVDNGKTRRSSNFTLTIRVADVNNNRPQFDLPRVNFSIYLQPAELNRIDLEPTQLPVFSFKQIGSLSISDKDSLATNSQYFKNQTKEAQDKSKFNYKDDKCRSALDLELDTESSDDFPFVFLVESELVSGNSNINVNCKLSVWLDLSNFNGMKSISKRDFIDFRIKASDNGLQRTQYNYKSVLQVRVNINEIERELFQFKATSENKSSSRLDTIRIEASKALNGIESELAELSSNSSEFTVSIGHVSKLADSTQLVEVSQKDVFRVEQGKLFSGVNAEHGVFLVDLNITTDSMSTFEQIQVVLGTSSEALDQYNTEVQAVLMTNANKAELDGLLHIQGLLFNANREFSIKATLFNTQSAINQFILLTSVVLLIICSLFTCCICLLVRRKCFKSGEANKKSSKTTDSEKQLNVSDTSSKFEDETGGFHQIRAVDQSSEKSMSDRNENQKQLFINPSDKVNRYLEGLSSIGSSDAILTDQHLRNIASPPTSLSSLDDSTKQKSNDQDQNQNTSKESSSSLSCVSDEGCYGSSDFSSESNNKHCQYGKMKTPQAQTYFSPAQSNYIRNLSRFEKIYNNRPDHNNEVVSYANNQQVIAAISGSYV